MINSDHTLFFMMGFIIIEHFFFMWQIHRLLNKAMSRSYHEYQMAENVGKEKPAPAGPQDMPEDLGILHGIG